MGERRGNVELRLKQDGSLDEIVIYNPRSGECLFHLEQMDDHYYWMRAYGTTHDLVAHIGAGLEGKSIKSIDGQRKLECSKIWSNYEWEENDNESDVPEDSSTSEAGR